ncbi:guanylate kinase [Cohaesibacter sp. ES.047]|uniref:guanylate kinase n=1 Tax=Cohaesibacter sp. ES.047 TaxID=1798205 RepID=UPI000BB78519|nr:guanylate kinase [Cohaesibacter sp. ES.047]SNY93833.1 guanylate kinase [Cohaesibacter sp. ES.047]
MSEPKMIRRGLMLVLSSPSGAGKSTIARHLLDSERNLELSVSATTRAKRGSEIDGVHYHFLSERQFHAMRDRGDLLEWAEVHANFYGTPRDPVEEALSQGRDVLFDIDWQGTLQLKKAARKDVVSIFILPPSMVELKSRLIRRAEDADEVIERRLQNARVEISHWDEYDYVIVNDDLERAFAAVKAIVEAERHKRERVIGARSFVETMLS